MLGAVVSSSFSATFGFTGATLILLTLFAIGASLFTGVSWLTVIELTGAALESAYGFALNSWQSRQDRKAGEIATHEREADCGRRQEAHHRRPRADPHRSAGGGDSEVRARDQGKAGAAVPGPARHAAAAAGSAGRAAERHRIDERRDPGIHLAPDRKEALRLRRPGEGAGGLPGAGDHALRDRAGGRRQGQPDHEPGEGSGACAVGGEHTRGRDHSGQVVHGAGDTQSQAPDRAAVGNPQLRGLPRDARAAGPHPGQGYRRQAHGRRPRENAAPAGGGNHRFGQISCDQRHDPVAPVQGRAAPDTPDPDRSENAGVVGVSGHTAPARAGGDRHEAGGERAQLVRGRDGAALQAHVLAGRAPALGLQHQGRGSGKARPAAAGPDHAGDGRAAIPRAAAAISWW